MHKLKKSRNYLLTEIPPRPRNCFHQYLGNMNIDQNIPISYYTFNSCCAIQQKAVFFVMIFWKNAQNHSFTKMLWKFKIRVICVSFDNITSWHVHSFAYDRCNWRDGIRYSYISFCAKSASISLVDFSVDIVTSKTNFWLKFQVELKFICAEFQIFFSHLADMI